MVSSSSFSSSFTPRFQLDTSNNGTLKDARDAHPLSDSTNHEKVHDQNEGLQAFIDRLVSEQLGSSANVLMEKIQAKREQFKQPEAVVVKCKEIAQMLADTNTNVAALLVVPHLLKRVHGMLQEHGSKKEEEELNQEFALYALLFDQYGKDFLVCAEHIRKQFPDVCDNISKSKCGFQNVCRAFDVIFRMKLQALDMLAVKPKDLDKTPSDDEKYSGSKEKEKQALCSSKSILEDASPTYKKSPFKQLVEVLRAFPSKLGMMSCMNKLLDVRSKIGNERVKLSLCLELIGDFRASDAGYERFLATHFAMQALACLLVKPVKQFQLDYTICAYKMFQNELPQMIQSLRSHFPQYWEHATENDHLGFAFFVALFEDLANTNFAETPKTQQTTKQAMVSEVISSDSTKTDLSLHDQVKQARVLSNLQQLYIGA